MSTLHQLAVGLNITEKTLLAWNKRFRIQPMVDAEEQLIYSEEQKELVIRLYYLIKEQGYTLAGAEKQLKHPDFRARREQTIQQLTDIRGFLLGLKNRLENME